MRQLYYSLQRCLLKTAGIVAVCAGISLTSYNARCEPILAMPAFEFVNAVGLNTHFSYDDTIYAWRYPDLKLALKELGVHHIRDTVNQRTGLARIRDLNASLGVLLLPLIDTRTSWGPDGHLDPGGIDRSLELLRSELPLSAMTAIEGPNEYNLIEREFGNTNWVEPVRFYQQLLFDKVNSDPVLRRLRVIGPSMAFWSESGYYERLGDISSMADAVSMHPYPDWNTFEDAIQQVLPLANFGIRGGAVWFTETGWHTAVNSGQRYVDEATRARNAPREMAYAVLYPRIIRSYFYQLMDDRPDPGKYNHTMHFGLMNYDLERTPMFYAVRNTMWLMCDNRLGIPRQSFSYRLDGDLSTVKTGLFQKNNGMFDLLIWLNQTSFTNHSQINVPTRTIRVTFEEPVVRARVYRPGDPTRDLTLGYLPVFTINWPPYLDLDIADQVTVVEIIPQGVPIPRVSHGCDFDPS